jgi:hypothetical protein
VERDSDQLSAPIGLALGLGLGGAVLVVTGTVVSVIVTRWRGVSVEVSVGSNDDASGGCVESMGDWTLFTENVTYDLATGRPLSELSLVQATELQSNTAGGSLTTDVPASFELFSMS